MVAWACGPHRRDPPFFIDNKAGYGSAYTPPCKALVKDVTEAMVRADGGNYDDVASLVWVFPTEIPDGQWAAAA